MIIMNMEILEEFSGSNDQVIVKGKRTKRPRQLYSTTSSCAGGDGGGEEFWSSMVSSPTTTSSEISTSTEEDEDMANCLILLARGGFPPKEMKSPEKISSRKFQEMATTNNGKVGIYVYQCKTCNRTFSSFQALGGHRASHKKPKSTAENDRTKSPPADEDQEEEDIEEEEGKFSKLINYNTPPPSTQLINKSFHLANKPKIHECSICGSEFASGQALGGHMRRHRSTASTSGKMISSSNNIDSSNFNDQTSSTHDVGIEKPRNMLALDLNLPAPPEDDHRETKFNQFSSNQQPRLVFSAAALVDCHY